jgi:poly(3-hydroxybutyrate) depolymerase
MGYRPIALLAPLLLLWCVATNAEEGDEPGIQYGWFDLTRTAAEMLDPSTLESMSDVLDADKTITWQVYVPDSYNPSKPAGLLVYISPTRQGQMPSGWQPVFDDGNLIFISADQSGNRTPTKRRMLFAALAPYVVSSDFEMDPDRIYVSGFSGGGKAASIAAMNFANLFTGAIYICGAEFWPNVSPELLSKAKANRYVFLTGGRDFNRTLTGDIYAEYERAGMANINLMSIPSMGHDTPGRTHFQEAIDYLDQRD